MQSCARRSETPLQLAQVDPTDARNLSVTSTACPRGPGLTPILLYPGQVAIMESEHEPAIRENQARFSERPGAWARLAEWRLAGRANRVSIVCARPVWPAEPSLPSGGRRNRASAAAVGPVWLAKPLPPVASRARRVVAPEGM